MPRRLHRTLHTKNRILESISVGTHYCLAVGNDEGLELDETDEDEDVREGDEEQVEEDEGKDVGGIQCGQGTARVLPAATRDVLNEP